MHYTVRLTPKKLRRQWRLSHASDVHSAGLLGVEKRRTTAIPDLIHAYMQLLQTDVRSERSHSRCQSHSTFVANDVIVQTQGFQAPVDLDRTSERHGTLIADFVPIDPKMMKTRIVVQGRSQCRCSSVTDVVTAQRQCREARVDLQHVRQSRRALVADIVVIESERSQVTILSQGMCQCHRTISTNTVRLETKVLDARVDLQHAGQHLSAHVSQIVTAEFELSGGGELWKHILEAIHVRCSPTQAVKLQARLGGESVEEDQVEIAHLVNVSTIREHLLGSQHRVDLRRQLRHHASVHALFLESVEVSLQGAMPRHGLSQVQRFPGILDCRTHRCFNKTPATRKVLDANKTVREAGLHPDICLGVAVPDVAGIETLLEEHPFLGRPWLLEKRPEIPEHRRVVALDKPEIRLNGGCDDVQVETVRVRMVDAQPSVRQNDEKRLRALPGSGLTQLIGCPEGSRREILAPRKGTSVS
mmetsp:Transcript_14618/g.40174  ORF Transcript_14618/g.40174 Transcript_14618/m.40174 type:complete len:473 (+) Transcript_14618:217-1635(+)